VKAKGAVPMQVLAEEVKAAIADRRVKAAVFTTFTFDPGFFELHVLPVLFEQPFSQVDKVRRIQLEDALHSVEHVAVYYDRSALSQDATDAQLDYRRIDVRRATGVFHPKVVLLLVEKLPTEDEMKRGRTSPWQSLVIVVTSANLTQAGWWENIECAHIEEIRERDHAEDWCAYRPDVLSLIRRIRDAAAPDEDHRALDLMHRFLLKHADTDRPARASSKGRFYTRLFCGQDRQSLAQWLESLRIDRTDWNLEVVSPYFDPGGAGPLSALLDLIQPRETRVYLPRDADGTARVSKETHAGIAAIRGCAWASLPSEVMARGRGKMGEKLAPRRVHAKLYRLWSRAGGDVLLVGSPNLTASAHSHGGAGNLEAAFFVDVSDCGYPRRWWLESLAATPERFVETDPTEAEGLQPVPVDVSLRFDWARGALEYRLASADRSAFDVLEISGRRLFHIDHPEPGAWRACPPTARLRELFLSTSFVLVKHAKGEWRVLVREENMSHRPSLLHELTPEEILQYWSLLTPAQRAEFLEEHLGVAFDLDGKEIGRPPLDASDSLFARFAGIFHAFGCLRRFVETSLDESRQAAAETRLFGAKYDSLPHLLEKTLDRANEDAVVRYVTFLCARQLRDQLAREQREFISACGDRARTLDDLLARVPDMRHAVVNGGACDESFLAWYEDMFLSDLAAEKPAG